MDLEPGEQIIFEGHPSLRSILGFYFKGLLAVVVAGAITAGATKVADDEIGWGLVAAVTVVALAIVLVGGWVKRLFASYAISNHRLYIQARGRGASRGGRGGAPGATVVRRRRRADRMTCAGAVQAARLRGHLLVD